MLFLQLLKRRWSTLNNRSGLGLFELLVALALLALIAAGLAGTMGLAVNMWDRTANLGAASEEVALRSRLRIWLRSTVPPNRLMPFPTAFEGSAEGFTFVTLSQTPFSPDAAALHVTVFSNNLDLILTVQAIDDDGTEIERYERTLATGISPEFSYHGGLQGNDEWQDEWASTGSLPSLVRIEAKDQRGYDWTDFIVQTRLQ